MALLRQPQRGQRRRARDGVARPDLLDLVVQRLHRSTSPITASSEPTTAIRSATATSWQHGGGRVQGGERRGAELDAPRLRGAVGDERAAGLAARRLDADVDLALGDAEAFGDDLEVVDQRLHRGVQLLARRQHDLAVVRDPRLALHLLEPVDALLDDPHRLAHLVDAHLVAVEDVASLVDGHVELDLVVGEIRLALAQVPVDAGGAEVRPGLAERDRVLGREGADAHRPLEPDLVRVEDRLVLVDRLRHPLAERAGLLVEPGRDVLGEAADLEVARVHARPGDHLEEVEHEVALAEAVPEHRDRADLERGGAEVDEVRVDPHQLAERHPHPGRLARHLQLQQLLDREHVDELVVLKGDVVDPGGVGDALPPGLLLHRLLEAGVQVADHCSDTDDVLAVQVDDQPQHAVRGRVVGAEVDGEDVLEPRVRLQDRRDRLRDPRNPRTAGRPRTGRRWTTVGHYSASEKRTGSPPIG